MNSRSSRRVLGREIIPITGNVAGRGKIIYPEKSRALQRKQRFFSVKWEGGRVYRERRESLTEQQCPVVPYGIKFGSNFPRFATLATAIGTQVFFEGRRAGVARRLAVVLSADRSTRQSYHRQKKNSFLETINVSFALKGERNASTVLLEGKV